MQGQSIDTPHKLRGIDAAMRVQCRLAQTVFGKMKFAPCYFHFDLFAGSGVNDQIEQCRPLEGSPLIANDVLSNSGIKFLLFAIEHDRGRIAKLVARVKQFTNVYPIEADNADIMPIIPRIIEHHGENPSKAIGSVLIDPNKISDVNWNAIGSMLQQCSRLDVIFNFPGCSEKRKKYAGLGFIPIDALPCTLPTACIGGYGMRRNMGSTNSVCAWVAIISFVITRRKDFINGIRHAEHSSGRGSAIIDSITRPPKRLVMVDGFFDVRIIRGISSIMAFQGYPPLCDGRKRGPVLLRKTGNRSASSLG